MRYAECSDKITFKTRPIQDTLRTMQKSILFNPVIPLRLRVKRRGKVDNACENTCHKVVHETAEL